MKKLYIIGTICLVAFVLFVFPAKSQAAQTLTPENTPPIASIQTYFSFLRGFSTLAPDPCSVVPSIKKPDGTLIALKRIVTSCAGGYLHFNFVLDNRNYASAPSTAPYFTLNDNSTSIRDIVNGLVTANSKLTLVIGTFTVDVPMAPLVSLDTLTATLNTSNGAISLSWSGVSGATGYIIERSTNVGGTTNFVEIGRTNSNTLTFIDSNQANVLQPRYRVRASLSSGFSNYSDTITLPSCINIRGSGPIKVIFLNGKSTKYGIGDLLGIINKIVDSGFSQIDPYKKYLDQFSFYTDLNKIDESLPTAIARINGTYLFYDFLSGSPDPGEVLKNASGCMSETRGKNQYIYLSDIPGGESSLDNSFYIAYSSLQAGIMHVNLGSSLWNGFPSDILPVVVLHEFSHSFAGLMDEYVKSTSQSNPDNLVSLAKIPYGNTKNCSVQPSNDYRSIDNRIYGSVTTLGCTALANSIGRGSQSYYRPSEDSLMNKTQLTIGSSNQMNIVGCGYVIAAIKGEELTKENGQKYFPECATLGTVKSGVPPIIPPTANSVTQNGSTRSFTITGSQFSPTGNGIKLVSVSSPGAFVDKNNFANASDSFFEKAWIFIKSLFTSDSNVSAVITPTTTRTKSDKRKIIETVPITIPITPTTTKTIQTPTGKTPYGASAGGPYTASVGVPVTLSGSAANASNPDEIVAVTWNLSDGSPSCINVSTKTPACTYSSPGTYSISISPSIWQSSINQTTIVVTDTRPSILITDNATSTGTTLNFDVPASVAQGSYQVYVNSVGSNWVLAGTITVGAPTIVRSAPSNFTGSYSATTKNITLNWTNTYPGIQVKLYEATNLNAYHPWLNIYDLTGTSLSKGFTRLTPGTYYYRARNKYDSTSYSDYTLVIPVVIP